MDRRSPRVACVLVGDIERDRDARVKYGLLCEALASRLALVGVEDAGLRGVQRAVAAIRTFRPDRRRWGQLFQKNVGAFRGRSRRAGAWLAKLDGRADVVLQIGGMLDARWSQSHLPSVIYTDYTARLSARNPRAGRSPMSAREREAWIALEGQAYRRAAHVCTRSEFVRENLIGEYGLAPDAVTAVGGGVNFAPLPESSLPPPRTRPTALFIGKNFYRKGGDVLLRAFADARARLPEARLIVVTGDPIPAKLPTAGVTVIPPNWDRNEVAALYRQADLFVLPSRLETWGDVLLEAMAHGLPCIGVEGESMSEIITPRETGLLVPPEDEHRLAEALIELMQDPKLRLEWGRAARRRVESEFTWERVVGRLKPFLESCAFRNRAEH